MFTNIHKPQTIENLSFKVDAKEIECLLDCIDVGDWEVWQARQNRFPAHNKTKTIPLLWVPLDVAFFSYQFQIKHEKYYNIFEIALRGCCNFLTEKYQGEVFKILLVNLQPNASIEPHVDSGFSLEQTHRVHLPIVTNEQVFFTVDNHTINMKAGELYEINNLLLHSVENRSSLNRIHIIIDIIEKKTIEQSFMLKST